MIIVRTPLRLSFVGGGFDLKAFYEKEDGMVIRRLRPGEIALRDFTG